MGSFSLKKRMLALRQLGVGFNVLMGGCEDGARLLSDVKQQIEVTAWEILVRSYGKIKKQKTRMMLVRRWQRFPRGCVISVLEAFQTCLSKALSN